MCPGFQKPDRYPNSQLTTPCACIFTSVFFLHSVTNTVDLDCNIFNKETFVFSVYERVKFMEFLASPTQILFQVLRSFLRLSQ
jgi:hypothetical protein